MCTKLLCFTLIAFLYLLGLHALGFTVVIDPGHGGADYGASKGSVIESKIALEVAKKLAARFDAKSGVKVIMTRSTDRAVPLKSRTQSAEKEKADLFVSLHGNSSIDPKAKGAEMYFGLSTPPENTSNADSVVDHIVKSLENNARLYRSQHLASETFKSWMVHGQSRPRGIKQAPFYVINKNKVPSILVEIGFITHSQESVALLKEETQHKIAEALFHAIESYKEKSQNLN
jgi:N-acetylmuramoyl-L-alanine amidase